LSGRRSTDGPPLTPERGNDNPDRGNETMNSNEVFDAMDDEARGMMRRHDAAEVAAGREPAGVQMHDALAGLLCSCFFHAMDIKSLDAYLRDAEETLSRVRIAANSQANHEWSEIEAGNPKVCTAFTR